MIEPIDESLAVNSPMTAAAEAASHSSVRTDRKDPSIIVPAVETGDGAGIVAYAKLVVLVRLTAT
ncbi:hypothetical protein [Nocardia vaccinii]|uniref:hypothetical protein n=1 Tax=Nocardia vaccinii TaxID=1822 RepID=UPI0012F4E945|nr:hypothetical protein [Nocardia vaccinii]